MTWRDVSRECEVEGVAIMHGRVGVAQLVAEPDIQSGYRLTKISGPLTPHVAFIVEKQE